MGTGVQNKGVTNKRSGRVSATVMLFMGVTALLVLLQPAAAHPNEQSLVAMFTDSMDGTKKAKENTRDVKDIASEARGDGGNVREARGVDLSRRRESGPPPPPVGPRPPPGSPSGPRPRPPLGPPPGPPGISARCPCKKWPAVKLAVLVVVLFAIVQLTDAQQEDEQRSGQPHLHIGFQ
ncbi:Hypp6933 [Branchiostoma lanceolatum]|uniref:Hypp6933 protein n=1 Tax=Branchiostoma lanceolatum TaxID=7740 RepID=A0A8J9YVU2_BRALA|nr:Hypp6933 [Branchiostoma lanceolatum]